MTFVEWASVFQFYAKLKRELRAAVFSSQASPECKKMIWEEISRILEEKGIELEEQAAF